MSPHPNYYLPLIEKSYSKEQANKFEQSIINNNHATIIKQGCSEIMQTFPPQPYCCAYLSALMVELARGKGLQAYLVAGSLDFKNKRLFDYDPSVESTNVVSQWSGHCWAVFNNAICDISFFRTVYSEQSPIWLKELVINNFGEGRGALLASNLDMDELGLYYSPKYIFDDNRLDGLLNSAEKIICDYWDLSLNLQKDIASQSSI